MFHRIARSNAVAWLRWSWRSLTSMRTALILLFLLAVASIPGSTFPQKSINPLAVREYMENNGTFAKVLDRLGMFSVFSSPWFAAIYLLLIVSLIGCVVPRTRDHAKALFSKPPAAPSRLARLPYSASGYAESTALDAAQAHLRGWRIRRDDGWLSAEKGYLKETGNLIFHASLIVIILGVGLGNGFGYEGRVLIREGQGFSATLAQFDEFSTGVLQSADALPDFSFTLDKFNAEFQRGGTQAGAPRDFLASITLRRSFGDAPEQARIEVNKPLKGDGSSVYLVGHGYAPRFTIRDAKGKVLFSDSVAFLPYDANFTSEGVIKIPDTKPQIGFEGIFTPTAAIRASGPYSTFPSPDLPRAFLVAYSGDLGMDRGVPQNVYKLDTKAMQKIGVETLAPGNTWPLPNGAGTITFDGVDRWASFVVSRDPGGTITLVASLLATMGLVMSLSTRRRRLFVRITGAEDGRTLVEVGGLTRSEGVDLTDEMNALVQALSLEQIETNAEGEPGVLRS